MYPGYVHSRPMQGYSTIQSLESVTDKDPLYKVDHFRAYIQCIQYILQWLHHSVQCNTVTTNSALQLALAKVSETWHTAVDAWNALRTPLSVRSACSAFIRAHTCHCGLPVKGIHSGLKSRSHAYIHRLNCGIKKPQKFTIHMQLSITTDES